MKRMGSALFVYAVVGALCATSASAQDGPRRSRIELRLGVGIRVNAGTSTGFGGVQTTTDVAGALGAIGYAHWLADDLAATVSAGVVSVGAETRVGTGGVETETSLVLPLLFGVRRYLTTSPAHAGTEMFASLEAGPVTGQRTATRVGTSVVVEEVTRTAFGARFGVGVERPAGSRVVLALGGGYLLVTDFSEPIGGQLNHSGPDLGLTVAFLLGGRN